MIGIFLSPMLWGSVYSDRKSDSIITHMGRNDHCLLYTSKYEVPSQADTSSGRSKSCSNDSSCSVQPYAYELLCPSEGNGGYGFYSGTDKGKQDVYKRQDMHSGKKGFPE